jgi:hypothetical protein
MRNTDEADKRRMNTDKAKLSVILVAMALSACGSEQCLPHGDPEFARGLVKRLALEGIKSEARKDKGGVCFAKRDAQKVVAIDEDLRKHFLATSLYVDQCQEKNVIDWATAKGLDFGVKDLTQYGGKRKGKAIYLYSLTAAEEEANKKKLMEAPRGPKCPPAEAQ